MYDSGRNFRRDDIGDGDFWDLSKSADVTRPAPRYPIHKKSTPEGVLIESDTGVGNPEPSYKIPEKKTAYSTPDTVLEYTPENIFISKVKITTTDKDKSVFNPSALFMRERSALIDRKGAPCDYVSFYAHSPRYSGMTRPQLAYYLWWRENVRRGELIRTDISYVKLYIQEIVTACDGEDVKKALSDLIKIARVCFDNPVGKVYMARIISDFCLLHRLECPTGEILDLLSHFTFEHIADEFFLGLTEVNRHLYAPIAIDHISIYNYKKSKFYEGESKALFDSHIYGAIHSCFINNAAYKAICGFASGIFSTKLSDRRLFDGRVEFCAPNARILVSYFPVSCISGVVTDSIRYSENKLRTLLGIRTSLAVGELPREITNVIDGYFDSVSDGFASHRTSTKQRAEKRAEEEYSHLYDVPKRELSLTSAKEIESRSWETTRKLTEAFSDEPEATDIPQAPAEPVAIIKPQAPAENNTADSKWGEHYPFLIICRSGNAAAEREYARKKSMSLDEIADTVNELAVEIIGDIILDFDGEKYTVIEDYTDLI